MKDVKLLFRDPRDKGQQRTLPTPAADILLNNLRIFMTMWKDAEIDGWFIFSDKVFKQIDLLKVHYYFKGMPQ